MLHGQNPGPCADLSPSLVSSPPPLEKLQAALPEHRLRSQGRLSCCSLYLHGKKPFSPQKMSGEALCLGRHSPWGLSGERQRCFLPYDTKIEAEASPSHRSRGWGVPSPASPSARLPFFPIQARNHHGDTWQCRHFATDHGDPRGGAVGLASGARGGLHLPGSPAKTLAPFCPAQGGGCEPLALGPWTGCAVNKPFC